MTPLLLSLLVLLAKSLAVLALSGLTLLALRRASAASRHLVCLLTLAALLALPLFSQSRFSLPVAVPLGGPPAPILGSQKLGKGPLAQSSRAEPNNAAGSGETVSPASAAPVPAPQYWGGGASPASVARSFSWPAFLLALWLLGVLAASLRPLLGLWGIGQLARRSRPEATPAVLTLAADCAAALGLSLAPAVRRGDVPVPMTWGLRRPVVLLPEAADAWPEGRMQAVLLHELAHIRRRDWASHRLADLAYALYWFHPLVWLTARRLRAEGEIACDDLVLSSGVPAPDYARHLLDIARALSPASPVPTGTVAMARTAHVEGRITMILKPTQNRRALTRRALLLALLPATAAVGIVAALRPAAQAQNDTAASSASWKQTLPNGAAVEVLGVSDPLTGPRQWWKPDGTLLAAPPIDPENTVTSTAKQQRIFAVRVTPPPGSTEDPGTTFDIHGMSVGGSGRGMLTSHGQPLPDVSIILTVPQADSVPARADFRCGLAAGAWETQATQAEDFAEAAGSRGNVIFSRLSEINGSAAITVTTLADTVAEWRVLAVDTTGKIYTSGGRGRVGAAGVQQETCVFEGLPVGKVKEVRFQTRPYDWVQFKNIALHPSQH